MTGVDFIKNNMTQMKTTNKLKKTATKVKTKLSGTRRVRGPMTPKAGVGTHSRYANGGKCKR